MCRSIISPPFFESLYWGMLIYFLSLNLLDVVHSCLMRCVGCICCVCFSRFVHSYLRQWLAGKYIYKRKWIWWYVNIKIWKNKVFSGCVYSKLNIMPTLNVSVFISNHHQANINMYYLEMNIVIMLNTSFYLFIYLFI